MNSCNDQLQKLYISLCKEHDEEPQSCILRKLSNYDKSDDGILDFSNSTLSLTSCKIIGKLLSDETFIVNLNLGDCMINEKSLKYLLRDLSSNTCIKELNLRGNNLKKTACHDLGEFLQCNQSLQSLILEWNSLGSWEDSFANFCDGLATNITLTSLDLRNNQIDHKAAKQLGRALQFNKGLQFLDLRWNNIGLSGGRVLADSLKLNNLIEKIEVNGNNIPIDIVNSIETITLHNLNKTESRIESCTKVNALHREIKCLKKEKQNQIRDFIEDLDKSNTKLQINCKSSNLQIKDLQETLHDRKCAMNSIRARLDMAESALAISEQKLKDQTMMVELCRKDSKEMIRLHESQLDKERKCNHTNITQLQEELNETHSKIRSTDCQVEDMKRKIKCQADEIAFLKNSMTQSECEHKTELRAVEERTLNERKRLVEEVEERDERRVQEVEKRMKEAEEVRRCAEARVAHVQEENRELQLKICQVNEMLCKERTENDVNVVDVRRRLQEDSQNEICKLQSQLQKLIKEKNEACNLLSSCKATLVDEQASKDALVIETKGYKNALDNMKERLSIKDIEHEREMKAVRNEARKREMQVEDELNQVSELRAKICQLEQGSSEQTTKHRQLMKEKDENIESLRSCLRKYEDEMERLREDETQRLQALHKALLNWMQGSNSKSGSFSPLRISQASPLKPPDPQ